MFVSEISGFLILTCRQPTCRQPVSDCAEREEKEKEKKMEREIE